MPRIVTEIGPAEIGDAEEGLQSMRTKFATALLVWSCSLSAALAQAEPASTPETQVFGPTALPPTPLSECDSYWTHSERAFDRVWFRADYLLWWVKKGPLPTPLVTFGSDADAPFQGIIAQPGTRLAYGGTDLDF